MLRFYAVFVLFQFLAPLSALRAQAIPAVKGLGGLQVGATYSNGNTDEVSKRIGGLSIYGTFDFKHHLGLEVDARYLQFHTPQDYAERSYLVGIRYSRSFTRFQPYAKILGGFGNTIDQEVYVNLDAEHWAVFAVGGGVDYHLRQRINIRLIDIEQQFWPHFPTNGLTPLIGSVGAAYRF